MKTRILTLLFVVFFAAISLNAQKADETLQKKIENNESGCVKEYIFCKKKDGRAFRKSVYLYDKGGHLQQKILYVPVPNSEDNWVAVQKIDYEYTKDNLPSYFTATKWDKAKGRWADSFDEMIYSYDGNGEVLITRTSCESSRKDRLFTQK